MPPAETQTDENIQLDELIHQVTEKVMGSLDSVLFQTVEQEVSNALSLSLKKAFQEGEFFRKVNSDMRKGLEAIYKEIKKAKKENGQTAPSGGAETNQLINEASNQLDEIMKSTEDATVHIMDIVENHQDMIVKSGQLLNDFRSGGASKVAVAELIKLNAQHQTDLMDIMTSLSFQDLTGQRIKKIITALKRIEEIVFNVYMTTGLTERARDEKPERNMKEIEQESRKRISDFKKEKIKGSDLKGPQKKDEQTSQDDVDDLLAQLGL